MIRSGPIPLARASVNSVWRVPVGFSTYSMLIVLSLLTLVVFRRRPIEPAKKRNNKI